MELDTILKVRPVRNTPEAIPQAGAQAKHLVGTHLAEAFLYVLREYNVVRGVMGLEGEVERWVRDATYDMTA